MGSDAPVPVVVADDGELDDVRQVLDQLGIEFAEASDVGSYRARLLITNLRKAF